MKGPERKETIEHNKLLEEACDIKIATYKKLPENVKVDINKYVEENEFDKKSIYDLTDSYFINSYINKIY